VLPVGWYPLDLTMRLGSACFYTQPNYLPTRNKVTARITQCKLNNRKDVIVVSILSLPRPDEPREGLLLSLAPVWGRKQLPFPTFAVVTSVLDGGASLPGRFTPGEI
jgi:hypothetical protein